MLKKYKLNFAHLYGDLMNTYGDWGNILALKYYASKIGVDINSELISLGDEFNSNKYDFVLFGGGQDYEETIVAKDLPNKAKALIKYIENNGPLLAVCGGFQLLGHYMVMADGTKVNGISAMDHYTENLHFKGLIKNKEKRLIGNITIKNPVTGEEYHGFENHQGRTFLGKNEIPLGQVLEGFGNNGEDISEGVIYKNVFGSYFHGPILTRNGNLAKRILTTALNKKYPKEDWESKLKSIPTESF
ncbi:MAG: glutamine amidotransferase [Lactobacillaceae bacterium]|jgi:CobQ-like glutamine amidotransferase family enzyme|nr:glutamine amidotransferase [Lactobacillaceae bacterium]